MTSFTPQITKFEIVEVNKSHGEMTIKSAVLMALKTSLC